VTTRQTNEGFIRRTIKPALGHLEVRKVRGPILDQLYARLKRCGDLSCTGRPFTEHRNIPALTIDPRDRRPAWQQVAETLAETVRSGSLAPGDEFPSITELSVSQGIGTGVIRRALEVLAADGLILARSGQRPVVAGTAAAAPVGGRRRPGPGHDCRRSGCRPHVCHPMKAWATHKVAEAAAAAGVDRDIKGGRHYTASQLLAGGFDLRNTAARLGHSGGGATTLRHYADPVPEVDRRAAAYLAQLTARSAAQS
jgi:DNA-binding transcriptional regulator YhcF (GntR family)